MEIIAYIYGPLKKRMYARMQSKEDSDDLIQDVIEKVWSRKDYFEKKDLTQQIKLVCVYANNASIDYFRKRNKRKFVDLDLNCTGRLRDNVFDKMEFKEVKEVLMKYQYGTHLLQYASGYSVKDLSEMYSLKGNTIMGRTRYARRHLGKKYVR